MATAPKKNIKSLKAAQPLILRCAAFLSLFVIETGIIGPKLISSKIFITDHFNVYGGLGKALIFTSIAFAVLAYRKPEGLKPRLNKWSLSNAAILITAFVCYVCAWLLIDKLVSGNNNFFTILSSHLLLIVGVILSFVGCLGLIDVKDLYKTYKIEIFVSVCVGAGFYVLLLLVYSLWTFMSATVLHVVRWMLASINHLNVKVLPPRTLLLSKFGVTVAQYCSGIESIALFSGLFFFIGVLDWVKLNHQRFIFVFIPALLVLFLLNILRVYLLILGGYYINPQIAFSLFHTYAGMIFFIIYSAVFWSVSYKRLLKE